MIILIPCEIKIDGTKCDQSCQFFDADNSWEAWCRLFNDEIHNPDLTMAQDCSYLRHDKCLEATEKR